MKELMQKRIMLDVDGIRDIVFGLIFLIFFGYFLLAYPFAFNFELFMHGHYFGVVVAGLAVLAYGLLITFDGKLDLFGFAALLLITAGYLCFPAWRGNEYLINASIAGLCLVLLRSMNLSALRVLLFLAAGADALELTIALTKQQETFSQEPFAFIGSLHNSGVLAVFLVIQLPLLWYAIDQLCSRWMSRQRRWLRLVLFCPVLLVITGVCVYNKARVAILTIGVLAVIAAGKEFSKKLRELPAYSRIILACLLLCVLILAGYYIYHLKEGSSIGHLLILDVSARHLTDYFWTGTGLGRFSWHYPQWQAAYFLADPQPGSAFFLSAGESYVAFNEFLELFETLGFLGFLLVVTAFVWLFTATSTQNKELLFICKATAAAILSCCCFHYPLHLSVNLLILALCFAIVAKTRENGYRFAVIGNRKWPRFGGVIVAVLALPTLLIGYSQYTAIEKWESIRDNDRSPHDVLKQEALGCYAQLYHDGKFLAEYGTFLGQDSLDLSKAIAITEASQERFISWTSMETLAYYYLQQRDYSKAIRSFEWLSGYVPNRFKPRMELLELYKRTNHPDSAIRTANFILTMPIKVASDEVSAIRKEAESTIKLGQ